VARRPNASGRDGRRKEKTYGEKEVAAALSAYVRTGSLKAAALETGIPWETIREWRQHPKWKPLLKEIRQGHQAEAREFWTASARDAAEGLQEAVLKCRQGLRKPGLKERDAALIARTFASVLVAASQVKEEEPANDDQRIVVHVYRGVGIPQDVNDRTGLVEELDDETA